MKQLKEKTQPEKELERVKRSSLPTELKASINKKLSYVNREIKK